MHGQILAKPHYGGPRYQQTLWVQVFKASLVVDTVSEAVTTVLNICEFLMKKRDENSGLICSLQSSLFTNILS